MERWRKLMLRVGRALISDYEKLGEARFREDWEIMQRKDKSLGTILQKIGVMISTGGFIIKPKGEY